MKLAVVNIFVILLYVIALLTGIAQVAPVYLNQVTFLMIQTQQQIVEIIKCVFKVINGVQLDANVFPYKMTPSYAIRLKYVKQTKLLTQHHVNVKTISKIHHVFVH